MDITAKYSLGQSVFYMKDNKVETSAIRQITIDVWYNKDKNIKERTSYCLFSSSQLYEEKDLFPTKEELLKSL